MRSVRAIGILVLIALPSVIPDMSLGAAAGKGAGTSRGKGAEHMREPGRTNSNAQWSADPERGWVRADERHRPREKSEPVEPAKTNSGQQKSQGKSRKF